MDVQFFIEETNEGSERQDRSERNERSDRTDNLSETSYAEPEQPLKIKAIHKNETYETTIFDFINCQAPTATLTAKTCRKYIVSCIKSMKIALDINNAINVEIIEKIFDDTLKITFNLTKIEPDPSFQLNNTLELLKRSIDESKYIKIHEFEYPQWNSEDELEALPHSKYLYAEKSSFEFYDEVDECDACIDKLGRYKGVKYTIQLRFERVKYDDGFHWTNSVLSIPEEFDTKLKCSDYGTFSNIGMNIKRFVRMYLEGYVKMHADQFLFRDIRVAIKLPIKDKIRPLISIEVGPIMHHNLPTSNYYFDSINIHDTFKPEKYTQADLDAKIVVLYKKKQIMNAVNAVNAVKSKKLAGFAYIADINAIVTSDLF